jgi:hypothetical protein
MADNKFIVSYDGRNTSDTDWKARREMLEKQRAETQARIAAKNNSENTDK